LVAEALATAALVAIICLALARGAAQLLPVLVPAWIASAYFFTSSTSFANPAVTLGRVFTDSFAGISPSSVAPFVVAQLIGAFIGWRVTDTMINSRRENVDV
ncbi:MAG: aquaporin family protein, partial [Actinobacteria bacterium]|nr:aquaporin family protein [Actinomycetota bacterium]